MSHEIYAGYDKFAEVRAQGKRAWHGLGEELPEGLTPIEAGRRLGILRPMELLPLFARRDVVDTDGTVRTVDVPVTDRVLQVYADTLQPTGVVGTDYRQFTNGDLAEFAEDLCGQDAALTTETCGTLRKGKQCFFLLRTPSILIGGDDPVQPYIYCATEHGGTGSISCGATAVRVVCANTDMLAQRDIDTSGVRVRHTGDLQAKLESAKLALAFAKTELATFVKRANAYAARAMTRGDVAAFMSRAADLLLPRPDNVAPESLARWNDRRNAMLTAWRTIWASQTVAGAGHGLDLWGCYNTVTEWIDHASIRGADDVEVRTASILFGPAAARKAAVRKVADAVLVGGAS